MRGLAAVLAIGSLSCSSSSVNESGSGGNAGAAGVGGAAGASSAPYQTAIEADAPLSYWRLGETSGAQAIDERGARNGLLVGQVGLGAPGAIASDPDTAATFNGTNSRIDIGNDGGTAFEGTLPMSIEVWINPATIDSVDRAIVSRQSLAAGHGYELGLSDTGLKFRRYIADGTLDEAIYADVQSWSNAYHHVVGVYDGSRLRLYVDGLDAVQADSVKSLTSIGDSLVLGARDGGKSGFYEGVIDEVAIYDKELSAQRVGTHYLIATTR